MCCYITQQLHVHPGALLYAHTISMPEFTVSSELKTMQ
jgi:hypothetical protein